MNKQYIGTMKNLSLYQEFDVNIHEAAVWGFDTHKHNFFELVYILKGRGTHILNDNGYGYDEGSLFLLTPEDYHSFQIQDFTVFCIITFNKIYFSQENKHKHGLLDFSELFKKLEIIFYNANHRQGEAVRNVEDKVLINVIIKRIIEEIKNKDSFYEVIIQNSVFLLLNIIARNIQKNLTAAFKYTQPKSEIGEIVSYIQQNIYDKNKLTVEVIADNFYKSRNYISQYFKDETGQTLKDYILQYKLNLIKNRLLHSNLTISQIADELQFTDESHLNKIFKLTYKQTAKQFRMEYQHKE